MVYSLTGNPPVSINSKTRLNSFEIPDTYIKQVSEDWDANLSIKQIDSLTSSENYNFTIKNYPIDASQIKPVLDKNN